MVKRLGSLINKESELIHSPFHGEVIRGREAITAKIKTCDISNTEWKPIVLHTYSPFGVEFINNPSLKLAQGNKISLRINLAGDETLFDGLVVNGAYAIDGINIAGVRTFVRDKKGDVYSGTEKRAHRRWSCSDDFLPTGMASNPIRYNDYILFRVEDISSGGLKLITSMRNKFLGIGQKLECKLSIPYVGSINVDIKIKYINTTFYKEKEFMVMGAEFIKTDPILLKSLGEYLLNFAKDITVKNLNSEGFGIKSVSKWLDFSYVKTEEDYREVLDLRLRSYMSVGKVPKGTPPEEMALDIDSKSNILVAKHKGKIVACISYVIPNSEDDVLTKDDFKYPSNFPKITETGSSWRFCVDKSFRSADITLSTIAYLAQKMVASYRRYWFSTAEKDLLAYYSKCGFKRTGIIYKNAALKNLEHEVIIMDIYEVVKGKGVGIKIWNNMYRAAYEFLLVNNLIDVTPVDQIRVNFYKFIGAVLNYK